MSPNTTSVPLDGDAQARASIAQRCARAHQMKHGWKACCPAHDDETPASA